MKLAIIMRGLPGSGKSTWAQQFVDRTLLPSEQATIEKRIFSTDDYFLDRGEYRFLPHRLSEYHNLNLTGFMRALQTRQPLVVCDNTNMQAWELLPYREAARLAGYQICTVLVGQPRCSQHQALCAKRNRHGLDLVEIQRMAWRFEPDE